MLSSVGEHFAAAPDNSRRCSIRRDKATFAPHPPSHPAATAEVGQLLDLGLALGHERFELISLVGREEVGMVAAHAWAECDGGSSPNSSRRDPRASSTTIRIMRPHDASATRSRPKLPANHDDSKAQDGREELLREVEWLRERVENLSRELVLARRDSGRLAKQLKQEEGLGREQRRKADEAVREGKALREELDRLREGRTASERMNKSASRTALSDAHSRGVRMAERRRRQQAESLMQAYKGLYEDQLQTQHASAESYRSLTRGYSRLSADNKALRRETAAVAAVAAAASDAAGNASALIASSAEMQQAAGAGSPSFNEAAVAEFSREEMDRPERKGRRRENTRGSNDGALDGPAAPHERSRAAARSAGETPPVLDTDRNGSIAERASARARGRTAVESAAAVATAAVAVASAAGALAEAATTASSTGDDADAGKGSAAAVAPTSSSLAKHDGKESATAERTRRGRAKGYPGVERVVLEKRGGSRDRTGVKSAGSAETNCPSTLETLACSPSSEHQEDDISSNTTTGPVMTAARKERDGAPDFFADRRAPVAGYCVAREGATSRGGAIVPSSFSPCSEEEHTDGHFPDTTARKELDDALDFLAGGGAPAAECCVARERATSRSDAFARGGRRVYGFDSGSAKGYAFPQTTGEEGYFSMASNSTREQGAASAAAAARQSGGNSGIGSDERVSILKEGTPNNDEPPAVRGEEKSAHPPAERTMVATPPVEPAPRWRGLSAAPARLLAGSASRAEAADVDAPKRSTSPTTPRRGRWGGCVGGGGGGGGGTWGVGKGATQEDGCIRIEPSYRPRPHSI